METTIQAPGIFKYVCDYLVLVLRFWAI